MSVSLVWDGVNLTVPSIMGCPCKHQLTSTSLDNLIEVSGRICYDSLSVEKSRNSEDYHKHIIEVAHLSVQEHANFTVLLPELASKDSYELIISLLNRIGVWCELVENKWRITTNIRAIREWSKFGIKTTVGDWLGSHLQAIAKKLCPLAMFGFDNVEPSTVHQVKSETDNELWVSVLFYDLSRAFSHEIVRHGDFTAISQRSTRYVNEGESFWAWHPLIKQFTKSSSELECMLSVEHIAKSLYTYAVPKLENFLIERGIDKFTARKQSRGAARGVLGNALSTEIVFSANISQWKRMLLMRAHSAADAEIRLAFNEVFEILSVKFPERFEGWGKQECSDGMGYELIAPKC